MPCISCRRAALVLFSLALVACGGATRLAYDNGDAALLVMAERYLDLEGEQGERARGVVQRFHAWHRRTELPRYVALLDGAADRVGRGLTSDDVEWGIQSLRTRYTDLVEAAVQQSVPLLDTLDSENIAALERRFATDDRKRVRETLSGDAAKRERARVAAILRRLEEWTGSLSGGQEEVVRRFVWATADPPRQAHEHRSRKQRELVALFQRGAGAANGPMAERLRSFFLAWEAEGSAERREYHAHFVELILELERTLTASQRAHLIERLRRYAEDCRQLSRGAYGSVRPPSARTPAYRHSATYGALATLRGRRG